MKEREEAAQKSGDPRIARALCDSVVTAELRLDNYQKAEQNAEFVAVELDRIEGKIRAISEMAVSHQDPDYISAQVDSVADSMQHTEEAIRELNAITGLTSDMEAPPPILETDVSKAVHS
jgi:DNA-binding FrmR family transcriptional regulator